MEHRNSQKRQYQENKTYFITFNVNKRRPFFQEELFCDLFIEELRLVKKIKQFKLHAFAVNLDHVHLLLTPGEEYNMSAIVHSLKRNFSRDVNKIIFNLPPTEGDIPQCRRFNSEDRDPRFQLVDENVKNNFIDLKVKDEINKTRFQNVGIAQSFLKNVGYSHAEGEDLYPRWSKNSAVNSRLQKGVGATNNVFADFDKYILNLKTEFIQKYGIKHDIPKFKWQKSFHDHVIRDRQDYDYHFHYTIYNDLKHELSENRQHTSLSYPDMVDLNITW